MPGIWSGDGRNEPIDMDPVSFYIYDLDNNGETTIDTKPFVHQSKCVNCGPSVEYNINGSSWNVLSGPLNIDFEGADVLQISLRLDPNTCFGDQYIYGGAVTFMNSSETNGSDLYQNLYVRWNSKYPLLPTMISSSASDAVSSNVPIPASALLLFSGLAGLIGFRRRIINR